MVFGKFVMRDSCCKWNLEKIYTVFTEQSAILESLEYDRGHLLGARKLVQYHTFFGAFVTCVFCIFIKGFY